MIGLYSNQKGPAFSEYGIERRCTVWNICTVYSMYICMPNMKIYDIFNWNWLGESDALMLEGEREPWGEGGGRLLRNQIFSSLCYRKGGGGAKFLWEKSQMIFDNCRQKKSLLQFRLLIDFREMYGFEPQSKEVTRGPPELVQHFRL